MPKYPSSFISGAAPGIRYQNNTSATMYVTGYGVQVDASLSGSANIVAGSGREIKDLTLSTVGNGEYPTNQQIGTGLLTNQTQTLVDIQTLITAINAAMTNLQSAYNVVNTTSEKKYATDLLTEGLATYKRRSQKFLEDTLRITGELNAVDGKVPAARTHPMPSDQNRGW